LEPDRETREETADRIRVLAGTVFRSLHDRHREDGRTVLFVYLPVMDDYRGAAKTDLMRNFFAAEAKAAGWFFLDLVAKFRELEPREAGELFIREDLPGFTASRGHYSEKGNRYVADLIGRKISRHPELLPEAAIRKQ